MAQNEKISAMISNGTSVHFRRLDCLPEAGRHSDAAHEIRLIGCCVLLKVVLKNVPCPALPQMLSVDWHRSK